MNNKLPPPKTLMRELVIKNATDIRMTLDTCQTEAQKALFCRRLAYVMTIAQLFLRDFNTMHGKIKMLDDLMD